VNQGRVQHNGRTKLSQKTVGVSASTEQNDACIRYLGLQPMEFQFNLTGMARSRDKERSYRC